MAGVGSFTEKVLRARRDERKNWTTEDELAWLEAHPEDSPLPELAEQVEAAKSVQSFAADLVPEVDAPERSPEEEAIDAVLDRLTIVEAYNRWTGKGSVDAGNRTEGIKVRCPSPMHADHDPSAWLNTDKDVWVCGGCGMEGGDKYDIAAWYFGYDVPGYKKKDKFPNLRREMAVDLGYTVRTNRRTGTDIVSREQAPAEASSAAKEGSSTGSPEATDEGKLEPEPSATVTSLHPEYTPATNAETAKKLHIDWRKLTTEGSFMHSWMEATTKDDLPEEYHFWTGLLALGMAVGNDVKMQDYNPVFANLFVTIIGGTGAGKSRSVSHLSRILNDVLPYDPTDPVNTGANIIKGVGSGEALIDSFLEMHQDGTEPYAVPVRGLMHFDELSSLVGKSSGSGSILKPVLMEFYDKTNVIAAKSRTYGRVEVKDAYGSCITTTQPASLRRLVSYEDADSGFLNRWVFVWGKPKRRVAYGGAHIDLDEPAKHLRGVRTWAATHRPIEMRLESDALSAWEEFFDRVVVPNTGDTYSVDRDDEQADALLGRLALLFKKLVVLFAIDRKELRPSLETVQMAAALWPYVEASYRMVGVSLVTNDMREIEDRILAICKGYADTGRKGPTRQQIANALDKKHERDDIKRCMKTLEELGTIEEVSYRLKERGPLKTALVLADHVK